MDWVVVFYKWINPVQDQARPIIRGLFVRYSHGK